MARCIPPSGGILTRTCGELTAWPYGYLAIFPTDTTVQPWNSLPSLPTPYHSEMYQLNETLLQKILSLTSTVNLTVNDNPTAQAYRGHYTQVKAMAPPSVIQCDTMAGDTWYHGNYLGGRAEEETKKVLGNPASWRQTCERASETA
jgi:purine nucleoside permease